MTSQCVSEFKIKRKEHFLGRKRKEFLTQRGKVILSFAAKSKLRVSIIDVLACDFL